VIVIVNCLVSDDKHRVVLDDSVDKRNDYISAVWLPVRR
jgi:hypothetical protein